MKARYAAFVALVTVVFPASVASARPSGNEQRVQIDLTLKTFVLSPLEEGALERDSGTHRCTDEDARGQVLRDGQEAWPTDCRALTFVGKRGTLVLRSRYTWIEAGGPYNIATGTWKVVRGTGQYASVAGAGRSAQVGTPSMGRGRYQGLLGSK
jgi:hypothetical protein